MTTEFHLVGYLKHLAEHDVQYVMVGGVGSRLQGAAITTNDLDIMPDPDPENLERLARALSMPTTTKKEGNSTTYEPHPEVQSIEFRTERIGSYRTSFGIVDVIMELPGVGHYNDVAQRARKYDFRGTKLLVASLEDIIASKQTTDRAKDWRAMDALHAALIEQREHPDDYEITPTQLDVTHDPTSQEQEELSAEIEERSEQERRGYGY